jgi:glutamate synthase (NADPH/NADH) large chain
MNVNDKMPTLSRPGRQGLYDPVNEKDSCGVGFVADMKGRPSHDIVLEADHALRRMDHRGGCGCEPNTGDGCGILTAIPHKFLKKSAKAAFGVDLPEKGQYAVGNVFLPQDDHERAHCKATVEEFISMQDQAFIGWRDMGVQPEKADVGPTALASMPVIEQLYIGAADGLSGDEFERQLYIIRKLSTRALRQEHDLTESQSFYICTLSSKVIVYKGMLTPDQLMPFSPPGTGPSPTVS